MKMPNLPGREQEFDALNSLLNSSVTPAVFVFGPSGCGKTLTVQQYFDQTPANIRHAYVHCGLVQHDPRLLYHRILSAAGPETPVPKSSSISQFLHELETRLKNNLVDDGDNQAFYIVLDHAHLLRQMDGGKLIPVLLRLSELIRAPVGVVLISHVAWELFREGTGVREPVLLHFSEYSAGQLREILLAHFDTVYDALVQGHHQSQNDTFVEQGVVKQCYDQFIGLILSAVNNVSIKMSDLKYLVHLLFPRYVEPVLQGRLEPGNTKRLFDGIQVYMRTLLNKIYLREISNIELDQQNQQPSAHEQEGSHPAVKKKTSRHLMELPYYAKFLVIASFLASYNPSKYDVRFFATRTGNRRGQGARLPAKGNKSNMGSLQQGPALFQVERMLGIFSNIVGERVESTSALYKQVMTLVSLKILTRTNSNMDKAFESGMSLKCNVKFETVKELARSVHFELTRYLYDQQ